MSKTTYEIANVFLEGKRALQPVQWETPEEVTYYIGDPESNIKINDFRSISNDHARRAIEGQDRGSFFESFSQPAQVVINEQDDEIVIELRETEKDDLTPPILWLGVFEGDQMTANPMSWYALRNTADNRTAFAAIVNPQVD